MWYFLLALGLVGSAAGGIAYVVADAHAFTVFNDAVQPPIAVEEITPIDFVFPPFDEGMTGYSMLAVLAIFEMLVAVGIGDALNRIYARGS